MATFPLGNQPVLAQNGGVKCSASKPIPGEPVYRNSLSPFQSGYNASEAKSGTTMIGQTVSHYRIVTKLGEGGMGTVYAAEDTHLGRRVAIKFLNASTSDHHYRARFLREARAISSVSHPNIATVFDYGETDDEKPFLVMELVEGETLGELLDASALTLWRAVEIVEYVADALAEAHNRGIVHRDIKPSNVIITERGQVKVLDFGLAKRISEEEYHDTDANARTLLATHTRDGIVVGTPLYLSPEQATGAKVDGRSDLFALGALLYECISGKPAFSGGSVIEIGAQVLHVNPPAPSAINPQVPSELDRITLKALAKKPDDRYQTAEEMQRDLAAVRSLLSIDGKKIPRVNSPRGRANRTSALITISDTLRKPRISVFTMIATVLAVGMVVYAVRRALTPGPHVPLPDAVKFYDTGTNFLRAGSYLQASKALEKAISIDPQYALAHARLAEAWKELDYADKAKDELLQVNELVPNRSVLSNTERLYLDAINAMVINEYAKAAGIYTQIAKETPDKPDVYVDVGRAYEKNEQVDQAIASYIEATKHDNQYPMAYLRAGIMYIRKREVPSATQTLEKAGNLYEALGNIEGRTEVLYQRGILLTDTGKLQDAQVQLQHALDLAGSSGNTMQQFNATLQMSRIAFSRGEVEKAGDYASSARSFAEQQGLDNLVIMAYVELANAYTALTDYPKAEDISRQALDLSRRSKAPRLEASSKLSLGIVLMQRLRTDEGFPFIQQAIEFFRKGNYLRQVSFCLTYVGREHRRKGENDQALAAYQEKLQIAERSGDPREIAFVKADFAMAFVKQERYPEALAQLDESMEINKAHGFGSGVTFNLMNRGSVLWQLGRYDEARSSLTEASTQANSKGVKAVIAEIPMILGQVAQSNRQFNEARKYSEEAIELAGTTYPDVALGARITLGSAQAFSGATAEGKRNCELALAMAKETGEESLISDAMLALAGALYEHGDFDEALTYALNVQERLSRSGEQESEWRAWLLAARCSIRINDREQARERFTHANDSLSKLQQQWGADVFERYQKRPDIQFSRKQLSEALFAVP